MQTKLTLEEALRLAESVMVAAEVFSRPLTFVIVITGEHLDSSAVFGGFPSRSAAWDAIEAASGFKRPIPKPDQDAIDNMKFPWEDNCESAEPGTNKEPFVLRACVHCGWSNEVAAMCNVPNCSHGEREGQPHEWETIIVDSSEDALITSTKTSDGQSAA